MVDLSNLFALITSLANKYRIDAFWFLSNTDAR